VQQRNKLVATAHNVYMLWHG